MNTEKEYCQVAEQLLKESYEKTGRMRVLLTGDSMLPFLHEGDELLVEKVERSCLRAGDIIVIQMGSALVIHRLLRISKKDQADLTFKGDNSLQFDAAVSWPQVLGRAFEVRREGRKLNLHSKLWKSLGSILAFWAYWEARLLVFLGKVKKQFFSWMNIPTALRNLVFRAASLPRRGSIWLLMKLLRLS